MPKDTPNERAYDDCLAQFRKMHSDEVWLRMHADPGELAYKLAGERVLSERSESAVQRRARFAYWQSWAAIVVAIAAFLLALLKLRHETALPNSTTASGSQARSAPPQQSTASLHAPSSQTPVPKSSATATPAGTIAPSAPPPPKEP